MLRELRIDHTRFVFIDFGCGKGKVLLLAAELPFRRIIGVELSEKLLRIAEDNVRSYLRRTRKRNVIELVCRDAADYPLPPERSVLYFWNPFGETVLEKLLGNIQRSLAAAPREAYIVYLNPVHRDGLDRCGFLTPIKRTHLYAIYQASEG